MHSRVGHTTTRSYMQLHTSRTHICRPPSTRCCISISIRTRGGDDTQRPANNLHITPVLQQLVTPNGGDVSTSNLGLKQVETCSGGTFRVDFHQRGGKERTVVHVVIKVLK